MCFNACSLARMSKRKEPESGSPLPTQKIGESIGLERTARVTSSESFLLSDIVSQCVSDGDDKDFGQIQRELSDAVSTEGLESMVTANWARITKGSKIRTLFIKGRPEMEAAAAKVRKVIIESYRPLIRRLHKEVLEGTKSIAEGIKEHVGVLDGMVKAQVEEEHARKAQRLVHQLEIIAGKQANLKTGEVSPVRRQMMTERLERKRQRLEAELARVNKTKNGDDAESDSNSDNEEDDSFEDTQSDGEEDDDDDDSSSSLPSSPSVSSSSSDDGSDESD